MIDHPVLSDTDLIERLLPSHMLCLLIEGLTATGEWELRPDLNDSLVREMARLFQPLDPFSVKRVATQVDQAAVALLNAVGSDDPRQDLYAASLFTLRLIDEGLHPMPETQAALVAILVTEEAADDPNWGARPGAARRAAERLLRLARLHGLYTALPRLARA